MKANISKGARKGWAWILAALMVVSVIIPTTISTAKAEVGTVQFNGTAQGWLESAYAEWSIDKEADGYTAYIKKASQSDSAYARIDNELIRRYKSYYRVDAMGLSAGDYVIRVVPVKNGKEVTAKAKVTDVLKVSSYDRSGFAFSSESRYKTGSGAYNEDGTLKSDSIVLYVTNDNAKTVTAGIMEGKGEKEYTGLQTIIDAYTKSASKGVETRALDVRVIGCLTDSGMDKFSSSSEGVQIKGASAYSNINMTFEGVGEDASISGFGFLLRNAGNVEMRNLSILNFMDDGISLDTANCNVWIHNVDLYYGKVGGDADQAKGDGSIDIKGDSQYITVSYVHFYDSGKCSLCGMKSESGPNYITYHHNWFDHSDSRHARVRTMSVHMYNNYYDGNAKYGVGSTMGSSVYVENNYFRNCKYPMLSSNQGSDALGEGTFSGENGGIIKAYGNEIVGATGIIYANAASVTGEAANAATFDAYLAASAGEKVPSSYKTVAGGTTYDNFDTTKDLGVKAGSLVAAKDVPALVTSSKGAGSLGGGVIDWKFSDEDDTAYVVDKDLKAAVTNYKNTELVAVGGTNVNIVTPEPSTDETTKATEEETKTTEKATTSKATEATKVTEKETTGAGSDTKNSYDKTSLSYSGAYTDLSTKKDSDFKNAKYVSSASDILTAISSAKAGDVIIVKAGTYKFTDTIVINNAMNGKSGAYIVVKAADGAEVKFDFSAQTLDGANRGVVVDGDYWHFEGINFYGAGDNGVLLAGNNNIFEKCVFEANRDSGLQISRYDTTAATKDLWPSNNLIINCTAFDNCDYPDQGGTGENADGFAAKLTCGEGNVFDGCISYCNSDDGWDLFAKSATGPIGVITIRNCVSFGNGTLSNGVHYANGDMNGFKLGGSGVGTPHVVLNCLSFNNGATGFTDNNNPSGLTIMNATAWGNGKSAKKGNFLCYRASNKAVYVGLVSANAIDSDKFTGNMSDSIYYNTGKYYRLSGLLPTPVVSGDKKGTVVDNPSKVSGMFKNAVDFINLNGNVDKQLRNSDGTINMKGLYETQGSYSTLGAHFGVANQVISVTGKTSGEVKPTEKTTKATEKTTETTKATEKTTETTKATEKTTEATKATEKTTEATKATESKTDSTVSGTKLVLNANDVNTGKLKSTLTVDGFKIVAGSKATVTVDKSRKEYKGIDFTRRIKLSGKGSTSGRAIAFKTAGEAKVKVYATSSSTDESRLIKIVDKNGKDITSTSKIPGNSLKSVSFRVPVAGEYYLIAEDGGVNIYYVEVSNGVAY